MDFLTYNNYVSNIHFANPECRAQCLEVRRGRPHAPRPHSSRLYDTNSINLTGENTLDMHSENQQMNCQYLRKKIGLRVVTISLSLFSFCIFPNLSQASDKKTIAIANFQNLTDNREIDWIGTGFAETLSTKLVNVKGIQVIERGRMVELLKEIKLSVDGLTDEKTASRAGKFIGAEYMILGSFQKVANQVMVNARIVEVESGKVQRSASAKGDWENLFDIQEELALKLAKALGIPATESEKTRIAEKPAESLSAYEWFAKGCTYLRRLEHDKAIEAYGRALEIQPVFPEAYYKRGFAYHRKGNYDHAIKDFDKAIALDPGRAGYYNHRGYTYYYRGLKGDYDHAIKDFDKAIALDPGRAGYYNNRGCTYLAMGDYDRAIKDLDKAIALNPGHHAAYCHRGFAYYRRGDFDRAIMYYNKALALNPEYARAYYRRGLAYYQKGDARQAMRDWDKTVTLNPFGEVGCAAREMIRILK